MPRWKVADPGHSGRVGMTEDILVEMVATRRSRRAFPYSLAVLPALAFVTLTACARHAPASASLASQFDCLRDGGFAVVAAHRGQPDPSAAENAISSFKTSHAAGIPFLEIDVATTRDGVLVLMHDDSLDRTTTGYGRVGDRTAGYIRTLKLKRPDGTILNEGVPTFADVLDWGRATGARFELDVKRTTQFRDVVEAVRAAGMQDRVVMVTYNLTDAKAVHSLDQQLMISLTLEAPGDLAAARQAVAPERLLGWTGTSEPGVKRFAGLRAAGIEPIFGTLGRPGRRLDDLYLADGDPSEYVALARSGAVMIASDTPVLAQRAIGDGYRACLR